MAREQAGSRRGFGRIEKRPSGRYRAAYTGPDGRLYRAPITFDAKDDAIAWLAARRAEIQMEVWAPDAAARAAFRRSVPTLRDYGDKWAQGAQDPRPGAATNDAAAIQDDSGYLHLSNLR